MCIVKVKVSLKRSGMDHTVFTLQTHHYRSALTS